MDSVADTLVLGEPGLSSQAQSFRHLKAAREDAVEIHRVVSEASGKRAYRTTLAPPRGQRPRRRQRRESGGGADLSVGAVQAASPKTAPG